MVLDVTNDFPGDKTLLLGCYINICITGSLLVSHMLFIEISLI